MTTSPRQTRTDAATSAPVRARLRAGSAGRDRAGPRDCGQSVRDALAGISTEGIERLPDTVDPQRPFVWPAAAWQFPASNNNDFGNERTNDAAHATSPSAAGGRFSAGDSDDWRKLVDGVLKGAPFEKLVGKTYDGLRIEPIYTPRQRRSARSPAAPRRRHGRSCSGSTIPIRRRPTHRRCMTSKTAPPASTLVFAGANGARGFGLPIRPRKLSPKCWTASFSMRASPWSCRSARNRAWRRSTSRNYVEAQGNSAAHLRHPLWSRPARRRAHIGIEHRRVGRDRSGRDRMPSRCLAGDAASRGRSRRRWPRDP